MAKKEKKKVVQEFKEFIARGNVVDLAVGVVIGGAFTTIVNTLVKSVLTPFINYVIYILCGGKEGDFSSLDIILIPAQIGENGEVIKPATVLGLSSLLTAIINFLLIALTLFMIIKVINKVREKGEALKAKMDALEAKEKEEEAARNK